MIEAVFVHLGTEIPRHLISNLRLIRSNFPEIKINLVLNNALAIPKPDIANFEIQVLQIPEASEKLLVDLAPDPKFRNGFWKFTLERLFILEKFHSLRSEKKLLHIESDIFLFPNFPFNKFESLNKVSWLKVSPNRDVAALVYLPTSADTSKFVTRMVDQLKLGNWRDDMEMLSLIMKDYPNDYAYLPSLDPNHTILKSPLVDSSELEKQLTSNFEVFGGVFDGVHLGIWLSGWDPRNSYGVTRIRDSSLITTANGLLNPENVDFAFDNEQFLRYTSESESTKIYSLHIHSKSLRIFSDSWQSEFQKLTNPNLGQKKILKFELRILLQLIKESWSHKTLIAFIVHSNRITRGILKVFRALKLYSLKNRERKRTR